MLNTADIAAKHASAMDASDKHISFSAADSLSAPAYAEGLSIVLPDSSPPSRSRDLSPRTLASPRNKSPRSSAAGMARKDADAVGGEPRMERESYAVNTEARNLLTTLKQNCKNRRSDNSILQQQSRRKD
jgi:hypothetical protein